MGMYDEVRCDIPLPVEDADGHYQTKDMACGLHEYRITIDGRLVLERRRDLPADAPERVNGTLDLFGIDAEGETVAYVAHFRRGLLTRLVLVRHGDDETERQVWPAGGAPVAHAYRACPGRRARRTLRRDGLPRVCVGGPAGVARPAGCAGARGAVRCRGRPRVGRKSERDESRPRGRGARSGEGR